MMRDSLNGPVKDNADLGVLFSRAVAEAREAASAEIALQKLRLLAKVDLAKLAVLLLVGALVTSSAAVTALVVGALLILQPLVGPAWATVIVVGVLLVATGLMGWVALQRLKRAFGASS